MTATDLDEAIKQAVRTADKILDPFVPDVSRWDLAGRIVAALVADHWRPFPPPPPIITATGAGTPPTEEFKTRKAAISRKDDQP